MGPGAAFFSDVEHEILEVTKGHQVTLTYNLYYDEISTVSTVDVTNSPFYYNLKAALNHPHFLRDGGVLGFACQHSYIFKEFDCTLEEIIDELHDLPVEKSILVKEMGRSRIHRWLTFLNKPHGMERAISYCISKLCGADIKYLEVKSKVHEAMKKASHNNIIKFVLKGSDCTMMLAARSLGLRVEVKPIIKNPTYRYEASPKSKYAVGDQFRVVSGEYGDVFQDKGFDDASHIFW